jgi:hypothetical protein
VANPATTNRAIPMTRTRFADIRGGMRGPWYVSRCPASTALTALAAFAFGCGTSGPGGGAAARPMAVGVVAGPAPSVSRASTVTLAGARCAGGTCKCREPGQDDAETDPPGPGSKRFEIRISAAGGTAALDLSEVGTVATGVPPSTPDDVEPVARTTCAYVDVPAGSTHEGRFVALESAVGQGVAPRLAIAEYGPQGPYWYDIVSVTCEGSQGRCDRQAADAWGAAARNRKRGRIDPCGSAVVTKLAWESSGGQAARDGGLFRDFSTRFTMEVKKFATQFAPGSSECVPK